MNPKKVVVPPTTKGTRSKSSELQASTIPSVVSEMKGWKKHGTKFLMELKRYQLLNPIAHPCDDG